MKICPFVDNKGKVINDTPANILQTQFSDMWSIPRPEDKIDDLVYEFGCSGHNDSCSLFASTSLSLLYMTQTIELYLHDLASALMFPVKGFLYLTLRFPYQQTTAKEITDIMKAPQNKIINDLFS